MVSRILDSRVVGWLIAAVVLTTAPGVGRAQPLLEVGGTLHFEAEDFDESIPNSSGTQWMIVPDEDPGTGNYTNDSGSCGDGTARHIETLPDGGGGTAGFPDGPRVVYTLRIANAGTYQFWFRAAAFDGGSDSYYMRIVETAGDQWWRWNPTTSSGDLTNAWQGTGAFLKVGKTFQ